MSEVREEPHGTGATEDTRGTRGIEGKGELMLMYAYSFLLVNYPQPLQLGLRRESALEKPTVAVLTRQKSEPRPNAREKDARQLDRCPGS